jgi:hypothetical protein
MSKITDRIARDVGVPRLAEILSDELSASDLQSLMLEVYRARAGRASLRSTPLTDPCSIDARKLAEFDRAAFAAAAEFEAIELSPVAPFGSTCALGGIDQNNVITTIRNVEILGDSTEALAIECARRRKRDRVKAVRLACSHRMIRMQPFDTPGFTPHFRLFAMVSAGRSSEADMLCEHVGVYLELCRALKMKNPLVEISDLSLTETMLAERGVTRDDVRKAVRAHWFGSGQRFLDEHGIALTAPAHPIAERVFATLRPQYPETEFKLNVDRLEGLGYYAGLCLRISPEAPDGARYPVIDGGFTDWTARMMSDRKERLLTSGIGTEFVCRKFLS